MSNLYEKHNYLDINKTCLIGIPIRVYDMSSGGYSILKKNNVFSKEEIEKLEKMKKLERNIYIGNLIREKKLTKILMDGFKDARKKFIEYNFINDEDILSIKKDALFIINKPAVKLEFDGYKFKVEDSFTSYYYLNNKEFYYSNKNSEIKIKGINDEIVEMHKEFFLDDLSSIFKLNEGTDKKLRNEFLIKYREAYLTKDLDIGCYRELNELNGFRYNKQIGGSSIILNEIEDLNNIDISYNYVKYLLPLFKLLY